MRDIAIFHETYLIANVDTIRTTTKWTPSTAVTVGKIIVPSVVTMRGYALRCTIAGTTGATEPAWPVMPATFAFPDAGDLYVDGAATWEILYCHGIEVRAPFVRCENVSVVGFPSNGIDLVASYATIPATYGSLTYFAHCRSHYNGGHGFMLAGDDTNAGVAIRNDFSNNLGFGVHNRAFLNYTWVANHAEGNEGGAPYYTSSGDWYGNYAEGNQGAIVHTNGTWSGGQFGAGPYDEFSDRYRAPWVAATVIAALGVRQPTTPNGFYYLSYAGGTTHATDEPVWPLGRGKTVSDGTVTWLCYGLVETSTGVVIAQNGRNMRALSVRAADQVVSNMGQDGDLPQAFKWAHLNPTTGSEEHIYGWAYAGGDWQLYQTDTAASAFYLTTLATPNWPQYGAGYCAFSRGFILGGGGAYQRILGGTAAPVAGTWVVGDTMFNAAPTGGSAIGWRCTVAGTPHDGRRRRRGVDRLDRLGPRSSDWLRARGHHGRRGRVAVVFLQQRRDLPCDRDGLGKLHRRKHHVRHRRSRRDHQHLRTRRYLALQDERLWVRGPSHRCERTDRASRHR